MRRLAGVIVALVALLGVVPAGHAADRDDATAAASKRWKGTLKYEAELTRREHMPLEYDVGTTWTRATEARSVQTWSVAGPFDVDRGELHGRTSLAQTSRVVKDEQRYHYIVCRNPDGTERSRERVADTSHEVTTEDWRAKGRDYFYLGRIGGRWRIFWSSYEPLDSRGHDFDDWPGTGTTRTEGLLEYTEDRGCSSERQTQDLGSGPDALDGVIWYTHPSAVTTKVRSRNPRRIAGTTTIKTPDADSVITERYTYNFTRK